jgi:hypothetical protein
LSQKREEEWRRRIDMKNEVRCYDILSEIALASSSLLSIVLLMILLCFVEGRCWNYFGDYFLVLEPSGFF